MEQAVIYLLIIQKLLNLKQKILILLQLCCVLETFQKTSKYTGLNGYVYDFSVDYAIAVDDIKDLHKYLMKKNNIVR